MEKDNLENNINKSNSNDDYYANINEIISLSNSNKLFDEFVKDDQLHYYDEDDIQYLSYVEVLKENIMKTSFKEKPKFLKKSINSYEPCFKKIGSISSFVKISPIELYYKMLFDSFHKISNDENICVICLDNLYNISKKHKLEEIIKFDDKLGYNYNVIMLEKCRDHFFHIKCLSELMRNNNYIKCPVCGMIYGILIGTQPNGNMIAYVDYGMKCSGYEHCGTIVIYYHFPDGGNFSGTSRYAFLPDNLEGRKTLGLLKICFDRRLTFTVGTSVTTGKTNTTVWAGIHHKTNLSGGSSKFGYPDPTYFYRVQEEMASKGVNENSLDEPPEVIAEKYLKTCRRY